MVVKIYKPTWRDNRQPYLASWLHFFFWRWPIKAGCRIREEPISLFKTDLLADIPATSSSLGRPSTFDLLRWNIITDQEKNERETKKKVGVRAWKTSEAKKRAKSGKKTAKGPLVAVATDRLPRSSTLTDWNAEYEKKKKQQLPPALHPPGRLRFLPIYYLIILGMISSTKNLLKRRRLK